ncbi:hypothetical protein [Herbaspirillum sp. SJZ107]|uniref:hypothetical protein n=1 Tax=Herbaspirillum sp. SJZ107 TaxID=2572881 RepID=UPI001168CB78|nr:hypothetical protein [Herbaspirillum sp. SJZ107]TQK04758.1 hypothetical protein FBX97_3720 [Herbaspirillum sp. SJZ107]
MHQPFMRAALMAAVLAGAAGLTGCASIVSGTSQVVSVETLHPSGNVAGATCKLENDKGVYYVTTPGTVTVHRAYGDMNVKCEKPGYDAGLATFKSSTKGMMAGNILFGGIIGAGVDASTGAAYDYPALFQVVLGQQAGMPAVAPAAAPAGAATPAPVGASAP